MVTDRQTPCLYYVCARREEKRTTPITASIVISTS